MKNKLFSILAVMVLAGLGAAQAAENEEPLPFSEVDKDQDGYISPDETEDLPTLTKNFSLLDKSGDGRITEEEYAAVDIHTPLE